MAQGNDVGHDLIRYGDRGDATFALADPKHDVRGHAVYDQNGQEIGTVEDLFVDEDEKRVRFLDVGAGGFLGIGEKHFLVPVGAVREVTEDRVVIDRSREEVLGSAELDPSTVPGRKDQASTKDYYGELPFSYFGA